MWPESESQSESQSCNVAELQGKTQVGEGKEVTVVWDVDKWDIRTWRGATVMIGEQRKIHERTRELTQGRKHETFRVYNIER